VARKSVVVIDGVERTIEDKKADKAPPDKPDKSLENIGSRVQRLLAAESVKKMKKLHGDLILTTGADERVAKSARIPSGVFPLDKALGGGWPQGRVNVIFGMKSSTKTTILLKTIAEAQRMCSNCWEYVQWSKLVEVAEEFIHPVTGEVTAGKVPALLAKGAKPEVRALESKKPRKEWVITPVARWYPHADGVTWRELFAVERDARGNPVPILGDEIRPVCGCKKFREVVCAFIDVEGTFDKPWALRNHVDLDKLLLSIPEYAEQSLDMADALMRSGECDIVVLDSIAFLTPAKEIEESTEKETMGVQPRVVGKGTRKFVSGLNSVGMHHGRRPTLFLTNQIRMKLGVMFGCFHGETPVMFADGSQRPIAEVVSNKMEGPVLSWDGQTIVERKIVDWYNNGSLHLPKERWLTFRVDGTHGRRGAQGFTCTPSHVLVSGEGKEVRADTIKPGDTLTSWYESSLSLTEKEIIIGSLFGDGHITKAGALSFTNAEQPEYLQWKLSLFRSLGFTASESSGRTAWRSANSFELRQIRDSFYSAPEQTQVEKNYRTIPLSLLRSATPLTLAIWYADDGSYKHRSAGLSVKRLTHTHAQAVASVLAERYSGTNYNANSQMLVFPVATFEKFSADVAQYLPACMAYKLLPEHQCLATGLIVSEPPLLRRVPCHVEVQSVRISKKKHRSLVKYDLQVEGNSYYLVGGDSAGVVVHNSPEIQPGGMAPGFAASTEVKVRPGKYVFDKTDPDHPIPIEAEFSFDVDKNKASVMKLSGSFKLVLIDGATKKLGDIYEEDEILAEALKYGIVTQEGSRFTCLGTRYDSKSQIDKRLRLDKEFSRAVKQTLLKLIVLGATLQDEPDKAARSSEEVA